MDRPTYQVMPLLSEEEYQALKADIAEHGVQVPVEYDDEGSILDGYNRVQICQELGIRDWPRIIRPDLSEEEKRAHARRLNLNRRHLNQEQKRALTDQQLVDTPHWSDNRIAHCIGITDDTVKTRRAELESTFEIRKLDRLEGADGKWRPRLVEREARPDTREFLNNPATRQAGHDYSEAASLPAKTNGMSVHFSSDSAEWYTPPEIVQRVLRIFGQIDTDPCANSHEKPTIPARQHFTQADDGLLQVWRGRVYMNPPYGRVIGDWVSKLCSEFKAGNTTAAVALVPARTDTDWFRQLRDYAVCFIDGRLKFSGMENSAPFPSAVVYLGEDIAAFVRAFGDMGDVWVRFRGES